MPLVDVTDYYFAANGKLVKWLRGAPTTSTVPGVPTSVRATLAGTVATITWAAPVDNGGSPVNGYVVTLVGGATQTLGVVYSTTFSGLTAGNSYTFTVAATNDVGSGVGATVTVSVTPATAARFPGDTRAKITGQWMFGINEIDKNPEVIDTAASEAAAPETLTHTAGVPNSGVRAAGMRYYFKGTWSSVFGVPNGQWATAIKAQYAKGRICFGSVNVFSTGSDWATATNGSNDATVDAFIQWCEESAPSVPIPVSPANHEPNFTATAGSTGQDYGHYYRWFRSRMDAYAAAHGGVGVYQWKNLSIGPILMGQDYQLTTSKGTMSLAYPAATQITATASSGTFTSAGHFLSNGRRAKLTSPPTGFNATTLYYVVNATTNTFQLSTTLGGSPVTSTASASGITVTSNDVWDWVTADPYIGKLNTTAPSYWTAAMDAIFAFAEDPAHTYPVAITEWGIWHRDPNAGTRIAQWYARMLTHDVWFAAYFNSVAGTEPIQWILDNGSGVTPSDNANLLDNYVALMKDSRSCHFWDLARPDGVRYPKPPGATF